MPDSTTLSTLTGPSGTGTSTLVRALAARGQATPPRTWTTRSRPEENPDTGGGSNV